MTAARGCSLSADALPGRLDEWRELAAHTLSRRVEPGRVVSVYPDRPDLARRLARLVAAERDCCPFLDFDVRHDEDTIIVDLRYPPQVAGMVTAVLGGRRQRRTA